MYCSSVSSLVRIEQTYTKYHRWYFCCWPHLPQRLESERDTSAVYLCSLPRLTITSNVSLCGFWWSDDSAAAALRWKKKKKDDMERHQATTRSYLGFNTLTSRAFFKLWEKLGKPTHFLTWKKKLHPLLKVNKIHQKIHFACSHSGLAVELPGKSGWRRNQPERRS